MNRLGPDESELFANSGDSDDEATTARIESLISSYLERIAEANGGWTVLFRDPSDHRFWELTYPESELHGGGRPKLSVLSPAQAHQRYMFSEH